MFLLLFCCFAVDNTVPETFYEDNRGPDLPQYLQDVKGLRGEMKKLEQRLTDQKKHQEQTLEELKEEFRHQLKQQSKVFLERIAQQSETVHSLKEQLIKESARRERQRRKFINRFDHQEERIESLYRKYNKLKILHNVELPNLQRSVCIIFVNVLNAMCQTAQLCIAKYLLTTFFLK